MADLKQQRWHIFEEYTKGELSDEHPALYRLNRLVAAGFAPHFDPNTPNCVWLRFKDDKAGVGEGILYSNGLFVLGEGSDKNLRLRSSEGRAFEDHINSLPVPDEAKLAVRNAIRRVGGGLFTTVLYAILVLFGVGIVSFIRNFL